MAQIAASEVSRQAVKPVIVLLLSVVTSAAFSSVSRPVVHRCTDELHSLATQWNSTGVWRRLSPYPTARDASPTDSVGVWLEKWSGGQAPDQLRRVSAYETKIATFDGSNCDATMSVLRRSYEQKVMDASFSDDELLDVVQSNTAGMIYLWSPGMPLSVAGIDEARSAANALGISFTAVVVDAFGASPTDLGVAPKDSRAMESLELVYRGGTVHYPTVVLYRGGKVLDYLVPGYMPRETYAKLVSTMLALGNPAPTKASERSDVDVAKLWVDHRARVTTRSRVVMPRDVGFYFKPVPGTSLVTYTSDGRAYLFDIATRREQRVPGIVDPVPTPDGRFLTLPGLVFHPIRALLRGDTAAVFVDRELPDEYQTASIIHQQGGRLRYRVVTGFQNNARVRDYDVLLEANTSPARFTPVGEPFVPCEGLVLSLPVAAKTGREFGAFDVFRKTNGILEVLRDGTCSRRLDLGFASGKLAFSFDGKAVAFSTSRINVDTAGALIKPSETFYQDALLLEPVTGRIVSLSRNRPLRRLSFPEFQRDGSILVLDQQRVEGRQRDVMRVVDLQKR